MLRRSEVMQLDMREVETRMQLLNEKILPGKIRKGLTMAGNKFMVDTVAGVPTVPIRREPYGAWSGGVWRSSGRHAGELRASGALFVDGVKKRTTVHYGEMARGRYQPTEYGGTPIPPMSHEACVVFNAPYAATQHESFPSKTQKGAGMYFMSKKLYSNAVEYIAIVAESIRL